MYFFHLFSFEILFFWWLGFSVDFFLRCNGYGFICCCFWRRYLFPDTSDLGPSFFTFVGVIPNFCSGFSGCCCRSYCCRCQYWWCRWWWCWLAVFLREIPQLFTEPALRFSTFGDHRHYLIFIFQRMGYGLKTLPIETRCEEIISVCRPAWWLCFNYLLNFSVFT